mgnify:CR=1 FL=1
MKMNLITFKQQAQDFILRLFVDSYTPIHKSYYIGGQVGTCKRLHQ